MSPLPFLSIGLLAAGSAAALALMLRTGETRAGLLAGALALLAAGLGVAAWLAPPPPLALDTATVGQLATLLGSLASPFLVIAVGRTMLERDRSEALHWNSMEAVRSLGELVTRPPRQIDASLSKLLELGCERFGLEVGLVSRIAGERYEVVAIRGPDPLPLARGAVLPLQNTFCERAVASDRPLAIPRAADAAWREHPARGALGFEAYLGAVIRSGAAVFGTLCFASREPARERFTATDKDLLQLMAQWVGVAVDRAVADEMARRASAGARASAAAAPASRAARPPRAIDVNAELRRMERALRRLAGEKVDLSLALSPELERALAPGVPFRPVVMSLVLHALDAMPEGGALAIQTANLGIAGAASAAGAAARYVTVSVSDTGAGVDAGAISRVYAATPEADASARSFDTEGRLPLPTVRRLLQRCGGDLSVDVEPGRGTTCTLFLPRAERAREVSVQADAGAAAEPTSGP